MTTSLARPAPALSEPADAEYRPFPNEEGRNTRQEWFEVPALVFALRLPAGGRILEVGCGRGVALPELHRMLHPTRLAGLDIDPVALEAAAARAERRGVAVELVPGDLRALPFPDAAFDLVVDFGTCYHVARAEVALREIARVLVPGGIFAHETRVNQFFSHPIRSFGRALPPVAAALFQPRRSALLWASRTVRT